MKVLARILASVCLVLSVGNPLTVWSVDAHASAPSSSGVGTIRSASSRSAAYLAIESTPSPTLRAGHTGPHSPILVGLAATKTDFPPADASHTAPSAASPSRDAPGLGSSFVRGPPR